VVFLFKRRKNQKSASNEDVLMWKPKTNDASDGSSSNSQSSSMADSESEKEEE
jgi:hypothetical protein